MSRRGSKRRRNQLREETLDSCCGGRVMFTDLGQPDCAVVEVSFQKEPGYAEMKQALKILQRRYKANFKVSMVEQTWNYPFSYCFVGVRKPPRSLYKMFVPKPIGVLQDEEKKKVFRSG